MKQGIYHLTPAGWEGGWKVGKVLKPKTVFFWFPKLEALYMSASLVQLGNNPLKLLAILVGDS